MYTAHVGGKPVTVENTAREAFRSVILLFLKNQGLGETRFFGYVKAENSSAAGIWPVSEGRAAFNMAFTVPSPVPSLLAAGPAPEDAQARPGESRWPDPLLWPGAADAHPGGRRVHA